jgi:uncharacterized membrane protein
LVGLNAFFLLFFAAFALLLPAFTRRDLLFGVTVPPGARSTPAGRSIVRGYRLGVLALTLALACVVALLYVFAPGAWWQSPWMAFVPVALALLPDIFYLRAHFAVRRLTASVPPVASEVHPGPAAELVPRHYGDYVPWIWESLPLAMIALTAGYLAITYAAAPAIIPTHFNAAGVANQFTHKTIGSYFMLVWLQLFLEVFLTVVSVLVVGAKAVPGRADLRFRRRTLRFLYFVKVLSIAFVGVLAVSIAQASLSAHPQIGLPLVFSAVFLVLVLGGVLLLGITTGQGGSRLGLAAETATDRLDDRYWTLGAIYANPADPSIFVERRFGLGWTLNFGNPRALLVMFGLLVVPIALVVGIALLATPR